MPEYCIETHAHTDIVSPCGRLSPRELVDAYTQAGYAAIVTTDHLTATLPLFRGVASWRDRVHRFYSGYRAVRREAAGTGLTVLPGFELTFAAMPGYDFLVYGIDEPTLADMPDVTTLDPWTFRELATAVGALVFQAHPFRSDRPADPALLDGVEVFNGNPRHDSANERAAVFAAEHGLLAISGSDTHQQDDVARGGITLPGVPFSGVDLVEWYRASPGEVGLLGDVSYRMPTISMEKTSVALPGTVRLP